MQPKRNVLTPTSIPLTSRNLKLTTDQMAQRLQKQGVHAELALPQLEEFAKFKKARRKSRIKDAVQRTLWNEFLSPLKYELKNLNVMLQYEGTPERTAALSEYRRVLAALLLDMEDYAAVEGKTPQQRAKLELHHNDGNHWADWVPNSTKRAVRALFEAVPTNVKAKVPFERKLPPKLHAKLKERLIKRTEKELATAYKKWKTRRDSEQDDDGTYLENLDASRMRIQQALNWAIALGENEAVPTTWAGFYKSKNLLETFN
mgnify:CR=1 FL=1